MTAYLPGGRPYFQLYRPAHEHAPLKRRATSGKSSLFFLYSLACVNMSKIGDRIHIQDARTHVVLRERNGRGGE